MSVEENKLDPNEVQQEESVAQAEAEGNEESKAEEVAEAAESNQDQAESSDDWQKKAQDLEAELAGLKEAAIRAQAEAQNVRRRAEQDVEKAHKFALEKFVKELLPVLDGLEKAVESEIAAGNEVTPLREGVDMTVSMMLGAIQKFGVEQVDPVGHPFDPALHEAMSMVEAPDTESNTVIAAVQKGYTLNGRLVRPAMVVVAK